MELKIVAGIVVIIILLMVSLHYTHRRRQSDCIFAKKILEFELEEGKEEHHFHLDKLSGEELVQVSLETNKQGTETIVRIKKEKQTVKVVLVRRIEDKELKLIFEDTSNITYDDQLIVYEGILVKMHNKRF